ncbi:MAG: entericidin A/B family lipoprotein [Candidatus Nitrotoga sp.]|nr:entericidin A/B family lipoprotein [Candidatus Nitrotoga sp.]MDP1856866.1 entericidin A/B family lipoprotein [Candidatus Nitrotoga sp.]MDP3498017.1 entericidin A/B family lipoprotein [Candidatus Nitrotoga sp.]RFC40916.1 MAG: putative small secreted protein [Candidatus Nitrotoga sp. CP45]
MGMLKFVLVLVVSLVMVTGCNTVGGFGKDLSKVGGTIEKTADDVKNSNGK